MIQLRKFGLAFAALLLLCGMIIPAHAADKKELRISIGQLPMFSESNDFGLLVDLVRAMDKALGRKTLYQVIPFNRSLKLTRMGRYDAHIPYILVQEAFIGEHRLRYSEAELFKVPFVIYSLKGSNVPLEGLKGLSVETDLAHLNIITEATIGSSCITCSLKKLSLGRIDAYIYAQDPTDIALKGAGLSNIQRQLYQLYEVHAVLADGPRGRAANDYFSEGLRILRETGEYDRIMKPVAGRYLEK